ncbi:ABC transporter substrate-binding protein [Arthrobacter sp. GCM10027362]|uniref:ABC transporter substrate-binding protein n=1 Tax=Arthrobacter sp. GCM10027362 TaxID=3273379 RepID=UPI00363F88F6
MKKHLAKLLAGGAIAALALTGCGSGSPSGSAETGAGPGSASGGTRDITVGVLSIAPSAAMQYGIDEGIFEKHGLNVELQPGQGGAAMLPAVSTGTLNFAVGNPLSVMTAATKGLDMKIVTGYSASKAEGEDINGVVTRKDSGISSWKDLAGKTTSVNALKTQGDLTIMQSAKLDGADPSKLKFNEMPFQDMEAQLERGNTDAVWLPEPFLSRALADKDNKLVGYPNQEALPGLPTMVTFSSGQYIKDNPEVVADFKAAVTEVLEQAEKNPDAVRAILPKFMNMPPEVAKNLKMETFDPEVRTQVLQDMGRLMVEYKFVDKQPDVAAMTVK